MSQPRVQIVDYRLGNLFSIEQACRRVGLDAFVSGSADELGTVDGVVLPGVGAFGDAMDSLRSLGLVEPLKEVTAQGQSLMGICLGMQLLFETSEEFGEHGGLGVIPGRICQIPDQEVAGRKLRVPNVGWNPISIVDRPDSPTILNGIEDGTFMYFVHSYCALDVPEADQLTTTTYGDFQYCSAVLRDNILGCQFHPEKSGHDGLKLYENWARTLG